MIVILQVPGATPEQLAAGVMAAQSVFAAAGVTITAAASAHAAREEWHQAPAANAKPSQQILDAAAAFRLAQVAAVEACCGKLRPPEGSRLVLVDS